MDDVANNSAEHSTVQSQSFSIDSRDYPAALYWGMLLLGLSPFLMKYCAALWSQDLYQYFPFLLSAVFGLAYFRFDHHLSLPNGWCRTTMVWLAVGVLIPAAALQSSWLGAIAFILITISFLASLTGKDGRSLAYLAVPLVMFVRAPLLGTYTVMNRLQTITTNLSSIMLDVLGIIHFKKGHTIELISKDLFVAEACSGVQSLFTICFLSLLLLVYRRRTLLLVPVYLLLAFFFAIVGNVIRVTTIALAEQWFGVDLSIGLPHELVGYTALAIATGMLVSFDHLIGFIPLFSRNVNSGSAMNVDPSTNRRIIEKPTQTAFSFPGAFAVLSRTQIVCVAIALISGVTMAVGYVTRESDYRPVVGTDKVLFEPSSSFLSQVDAPISVVSYEVNRDAHADRNARHGMNSDIWTCGIGSHQGQFVLSQPYMGWHELTICYKVQDWQMTSRQTVSVNGFSQPIVVAEFASDEGQYGCLVFTAVDSNGKIPRPPGYSPYSRALAPLYPLIMDDFAETSGSAQTVMLQYWMIEKEPISEDVKQAVVSTMAKIRQRTSQEIEKQFFQQRPTE